MGKHLIQFQKSGNLKKRLFCFPYAGAGAAVFRPWVALLPPEIELIAVELPGRVHLKEKAPETMEELIDVLYPEILLYLDKPFAFFGHSFGSVVAYEMAKRLRNENKALPSHLFVSSRRPPNVASPLFLAHLDDKNFLVEIQKVYGAIPAAVLNDQALLALFLPILKADIKINETYVGTITPPLSVPVTVFYGQEDSSGSNLSLQDWQKVTTGPLVMKSFPGGHFYIDSCRGDLVKGIVSET